jgi:uncharacterized small protein (DUF1192 family)
MVALSVLAGCTGTPSSGGNGDTGTTGGGGYTAPPVPDEISLEQVWDEDGCLADAAVVDGTFVAGRRTNLCRVADSSNPNYHSLYARGTDPATQWYQVYGIEGGYAYWRYPDSPWFRAPQNGGNMEIMVQNADGGTSYEDYQAWMDASVTNYATGSGYNLKEMSQQGSMRIAEVTTFEDVTSTDARLTEAQAEIARLKAELEAKQQEQQAGQGGGMNAEEVKLWQMEWNNRMARIWTQPDCNFSSNGCW